MGKEAGEKIRGKEAGERAPGTVEGTGQGPEGGGGPYPREVVAALAPGADGRACAPQQLLAGRSHLGGGHEGATEGSPLFSLLPSARHI